MFDRMTSFSYVPTYIFCLNYVFIGYDYYGYPILCVLIFITVINYVLLKKSFRKIKEMAEKEMTVEVVREGQIKTIDSK